MKMNPKVMACRSGTLKAHEASARHKRAVANSKAAEAKLALQQRKNATLEHLYAPGRSQAERARLQQLRRLFHLLTRGRPMLDYTASEVEFEVLKVPDLPTSHWSGTAGWEMAEALGDVLTDKVKELVRGARFLAISMDECVGVDKRERLSLHVYVMDAGWSRMPLFIDVSLIKGGFAWLIIKRDRRWSPVGAVGFLTALCFGPLLPGVCTEIGSCPPKCKGHL